MTSKYYRLTHEGFGQTFWEPRIFTPFQEGTIDFEEPYSNFIPEDPHLKEIVKNTKNKPLDIIKLFYCYGYPDQYCICLDEPNKENPSLFGIYEFDLFNTAVNEVSLEEYLNSCLTKYELFEIVKVRMKKNEFPGRFDFLKLGLPPLD